MEAKKNILTYEGLKKYEEELQELKVVKRREVAQKIKGNDSHSSRVKALILKMFNK